MKIYSSTNELNVKKPYIFLRSSDWDDYNYKSTYVLEYCSESTDLIIGEVKIINSDLEFGRVTFENGTDGLGSNFCSLGQSESYYRNLKKLGDDVCVEILKSLNDCAYDNVVYEMFKDLDQFKSSAVRFSTAEQALKFGREIFNRDVSLKESPSHSFAFKTRLNGFGSDHIIDFTFFNKDDKEIPSSINVIIGRNGTGKTQLLSDLARTISGYGFNSKKELIRSRDTKFSGAKPSFGNVIVISYSAFDNFEIPGKDQQERAELEAEGHVHGYKYCGLRERVESGRYRLKDISEITKEFEKSYKNIRGSDCAADWDRCIEHVLADSSFRSVNKNDLVKSFISLSSGQKIILSILASVFEHIENNSIVIIDEPETHLHPSLMAAFIHSIRSILERFDSYAVVATHSPVILQETPSMFVQVLEGTPQRPKVTKLKSECFGEEISTLTEDVFHVSIEESNFYKVLNDLSNKGFSLTEVERMFKRRLSFTAKSFFETL